MKMHFPVFGDPVELVVASSQTGGSYSIGRQTCKPGGGTPPHLHTNEDEVFSVVSGRFEIFANDVWAEVPQDKAVFAPRGQVHCFRNCGDEDGIIQFVAGGSRFDVFLEGLSAYDLPQDIQAIVDYSAKYGIFYPTLPPPSETAAPEHESRVELVAS